MTKLEAFVRLPYEFVGKNFDTVNSQLGMGLSRGTPWCAYFITNIARKVGGILGVILISTGSSAAMTKDAKGVSGRYIQGAGVTPIPGDIMYYPKGHVGIVVKVSGSTITLVEGNAGGGSGSATHKCLEKTRNVGNSVIGGYWRPEWAKVGSFSGDLGNLGGSGGSGGSGEFSEGFGSGSYQPLYDRHNTRIDGTIREVGIMDSSYKPSISISTSMPKLSVINYTSMLSAMFMGAGSDEDGDGDGDGGGGGGGNYGDVIIGNITGHARTVAEYLLGKGLNRAATAGIMGNIEAESGFNPAAAQGNGNYPLGVGIIQWSGGRRTNLINAVPNWKTNLTGQLNFLWGELSGGYKDSTLTPIKSVADSDNGCGDAVDIFLHRFEKPCIHTLGAKSCKEFKSRYGGASGRRGALSFFRSMTIQPNRPSTGNSLSTSQGYSRLMV